MADETTTTTATEQAQTAENTTQQTANTSETTEKTFTQAELDKVVADRLAREKAKLPTKEDLAEYKKWREENQTAEEKTAAEIKAAQEAKSAAEQKAAQLEAKYTAMTKGVKSDAVDDVIALALGKVSETVTLEQAIDGVIAKYPQFSGATQPAPITTSVATGDGTTTLSGVEAAFLARNPDLKLT